MLFVTNDANCSSYTHHIKELFCSPKEKDLTLPLNLTLMTVIIYTGNKVKSNRGEEKKKGFNRIFLFWSANNIRENILHLVNIIGENIPEFYTFVAG